MPQSMEDFAVLFESEYGAFQKRYWWLVGVVGLIGLVGVPLGIFYNEGWTMHRRPVEPWAAMLIIECVSVGALLLAAYVGLETWRCRRSPQRVAVTPSSLIVPQRAFSSAELVLPLSEIQIRVFEMWFVKQLQVKHGRRKVLLVSTKFPSNANMDRLLELLGE